MSIREHSDIQLLLAEVRRVYAAIERFDQAMAVTLNIDRSALRAVNAMESGPISPTAIALQLGLTSGAVTALLDRLDSAGHIERIAIKSDRRKRDVTLTKKARSSAGQKYGLLGKTIAKSFLSDDAASFTAASHTLTSLANAFDIAAKEISKSG
jgi:DNA-binding MarR family transcriptional regulator